MNMSRSSPETRPSYLKRIRSIGRILWPAALVFVALDLSVDPDVSILRSFADSETSASEDLQIVSLNNMQSRLPAIDPVDESATTDHVWFGVEETADAIASSGSTGLNVVNGGWSGQFASVLDGDSQDNCWSAYEVNVQLTEQEGQINGPGSYVADPSACSTHDQPVVAFFNATGERTGSRVSLMITDDASDGTTMLFNGVIAGDNIVGAFSMPNGAPASGTVVMRLTSGQ
jgi:hypothetical protein